MTRYTFDKDGKCIAAHSHDEIEIVKPLNVPTDTRSAALRANHARLGLARLFA